MSNSEADTVKSTKPSKNDYVRLEHWGDSWFRVHSIIRDKWIYLDDGVDYTAYLLDQAWIIRQTTDETNRQNKKGIN